MQGRDNRKKINVLLGEQEHDPQGRRKRRRFEIQGQGIVECEIPSVNVQGEVVDLSYNGAMVLYDTDQGATPPRLGSETLCMLSGLKLKAEVEGKIVHSSGGAVGIEFLHRNSEGLLFLREVIEPMRKGYTLKGRTEDYWQDDRMTLVGEGPTEVSMMRSNTGDLIYGRVSANVSGQILESTLENGKVTTGQATVDFSTSYTPIVASELEPHILRLTAMIVAGSLYNQYDPTLHEFYRKLMHSLMPHNPRFHTQSDAA